MINWKLCGIAWSFLLNDTLGNALSLAKKTVKLKTPRQPRRNNRHSETQRIAAGEITNFLTAFVTPQFEFYRLPKAGWVSFFEYLLYPILGVRCKIDTLGLQSITQLFGHQTCLQSCFGLRINEVTSGIDEESEKRHGDVILIEEQVRMRAEGQKWYWKGH